MNNGENLYEIIAENIRRERNKLCISQEKLAEKADISVATMKNMRKIETGSNGVEVDTLVNIANLFHIELDYLICGWERGVQSEL